MRLLLKRLFQGSATALELKALVKSSGLPIPSNLSADKETALILSKMPVLFARATTSVNPVENPDVNSTAGLAALESSPSPEVLALLATRSASQAGAPANKVVWRLADGALESPYGLFVWEMADGA